MKGLTYEERRALEPIGPPGEYASGQTIASLIERGLASWQPVSRPWHLRWLPGGRYALVPTELGRIMLALPPEP